MKIQSNHFSCCAVHFLRESVLTSLTPLQRKVMAIASIAIACLAACLAAVHIMRRCGGKSVQDDPKYQKLKPDGNPKLKPDWINAHPTVPLKNFGLTNFDMLEGFLKEHGRELECLNLLGLDKDNELDDDQFQQLIQYCPNLAQVCIRSGKISDKALEHLQGMPLTSVNFGSCSNLTDKALENLKGMPLTKVDFSMCSKLTDAGLEHLKGMPLMTVDFSWCSNLTDKALEHLNGLPLKIVNFYGCRNITHKACDDLINHFALKGMQLKINR